ncbi:MAG: tyrosine-type recombinase/integrase [Microcella sp.]|uniref:tyrosine-type recombinase/integrase n=1 Tax=Microcella sp. TaxID=1913979 RepID=UPI003315FC33
MTDTVKVGTIRQRSNGTFEGRISYRDDDDRPVRRSFYGSTEKQVAKKLREAEKRVQADLSPADSNMLVSTWLTRWADTILPRSNRKATTMELYRTLLRKHLQESSLSHMQLGRVKASHIDALVTELTDSGLSQSSVRSIYTVLRTALDGAVREGLLATNPAAKVDRPTVARTEARHLSGGEVRAILDAAATSRYHPALALIAATGMRRGEALALRWEHVDLTKKLVRVRGTLARVDGHLTVTEPKTANSRRDIVLTESMVRTLKRHATTQKAERLRAGNQWQDTKLVFTTELGTAVDPRNLLRVFTVAAKTAGITDVGLHTLRHSAATAMLDAGVPLHVVSRILGHSSVAITGDVYGHLVDSTQADAMDQLAAALGI